MSLRLFSVFVPLMSIGVIGGHAFANAVVGAPPNQTEVFTTAATGDTLLPALLAMLAALALVLAAAGAGRATSRKTSLWLFAALPVVFFAGLEIAEAVLAQESLLTNVLLAPAFGLGLVAQLPLALVCLGCGLLLLRVGTAVCRALAAAESWTAVYLVIAPDPGDDQLSIRDLRLERIRSRGPPVPLRMS